MDEWTVWQLVDSALPVGGFAHSGGLEAAWRGGHIFDEQSLTNYLVSQLCQWSSGILPLAIMAFRNSRNVIEADRLCDLYLNNPISNRASRAQGRAMLSMGERIFAESGLAELKETLKPSNSPAHFAPILGCVCRLLGFDAPQTSRLVLFLNLRGALSAAIRLGLIGPLAAGKLQHDLRQAAEYAAVYGLRISPDEVAQTSPIAELFAAGHDRLYSRLFQS